MTYGTVRWFDPQRGIGTIAIDGSGHEVPVSASDIDGSGRQSLAAATRVAFTVLDGPHGPRAAHVWTP